MANYPILKYYDINDNNYYSMYARSLFNVMPANEVLVRHSFRKSNQLLLHHEHCLHLNKGMHRSRRNMSSHCVWLPKVLTVHHKTVTVESELVFTCYPGYLRNMCSLRSVSYSLHGNYVFSLLSTKSTTYGLHSFSYMASKLCNSLLDSFRTSDFPDFKRKILQ